jgi:hypothetical protein
MHAADAAYGWRRSLLWKIEERKLIAAAHIKEDVRSELPGQQQRERELHNNFRCSRAARRASPVSSGLEAETIPHATWAYASRHWAKLAYARFGVRSGFRVNCKIERFSNWTW